MSSKFNTTFLFIYLKLSFIYLRESKHKGGGVGGEGGEEQRRREKQTPGTAGSPMQRNSISEL